ncbi:hypothetical protein R3P38DRAFT_2816467 [Favolaschia claudopus]|uniref:Ribonuclease H1 N-terminal domain-containing protein n=1 Tax=Favolaschia claudopus TaxID=2862362 RepID=A0AAV9YYM3_9AGAR
MNFPSPYAAIPQFLTVPPVGLPTPQPVVVVVYGQGPPPAPSTAPKVKENKDAASSAPKEAVAPAPKDKTAGFPAPLIALLRTDGPFLANKVFSVAPTSPLQAIPEDPPAKEWYAVFRGRFVGVFSQYSLADFAVAGVGQGARKMYDTQSEALAAFNDTLTWGGVIVV